MTTTLLWLRVDREGKEHIDSFTGCATRALSLKKSLEFHDTKVLFCGATDELKFKLDN